MYAEEKRYIFFLGMPFLSRANTLLSGGRVKQILKFINIFYHWTYDSPTRQYLDFEAARTRRTQSFLNSKPKCYRRQKDTENPELLLHTKAEGNLDTPLLKEYESFQGVGTDLLVTILMVFGGGKCLSKKIIFFFNICTLNPGEITERPDPDTVKIHSDCTIKHACICE